MGTLADPLDGALALHLDQAMEGAGMDLLPLLLDLEPRPPDTANDPAGLHFEGGMGLGQFFDLGQDLPLHQFQPAQEPDRSLFAQLGDLDVAVLVDMEQGVLVEGEGRLGPGPGHDMVARINDQVFLGHDRLVGTALDQDLPLDLVENVLEFRLGQDQFGLGGRFRGWMEEGGGEDLGGDAPNGVLFFLFAAAGRGKRETQDQERSEMDSHGLPFLERLLRRRGLSYWTGQEGPGF
jgi:hypothetical protein